ncbi:MAG: single-stranded DNA-binding protein [Actinobacteria bacterium]|nr:single-stranded DNA-binding protein [Actinomycetota bacterium]
MTATRSDTDASTADKAAVAAVPGPTEVDINTATIVGTLSSDPIERTLPSGDQLVSFEITTRVVGEATRSVPVAWTSPKPSWRSLAAGDRVVATGQVVRRFFRAGGSTVSRTEVVAEAVQRDRPAARQRIIKRARARIET